MALPYFPALIFTAAGMAVPLWRLTFTQNNFRITQRWERSYPGLRLLPPAPPPSAAAPRRLQDEKRHVLRRKFVFRLGIKISEVQRQHKDQTAAQGPQGGAGQDPVQRPVQAGDRIEPQPQ